VSRLTGLGGGGLLGKPFSASDDDFAKLSFDVYLDDMPFTVNEVLF
jgi:hypothetical protein